MRRLYKTPGQHLTLGQVVELNRRLLEGYVHFKNEPRVQKLREDVLKYNRLVRDLGLRDHQVLSFSIFLSSRKANMSTGTPSPKGKLENSWTSDISRYTPPNLEHSCTTWDNPQRPNAHTGICDFPEKGET